MGDSRTESGSLELDLGDGLTYYYRPGTLPINVLTAFSLVVTTNPDPIYYSEEENMPWVAPLLLEIQFFCLNKECDIQVELCEDLSFAVTCNSCRAQNQYNLGLEPAGVTLTETTKEAKLSIAELRIHGKVTEKNSRDKTLRVSITSTSPLETVLWTRSYRVLSRRERKRKGGPPLQEVLQELKEVKRICLETAHRLNGLDLNVNGAPRGSSSNAKALVGRTVWDAEIQLGDQKASEVYHILQKRLGSTLVEEEVISHPFQGSILPIESVEDICGPGIAGFFLELPEESSEELFPHRLNNNESIVISKGIFVFEDMEGNRLLVPVLPPTDA